ncbi:MAG: hypothetical protein R3F20_18770 [Planctomycetota bacterium]
MPIALTTLLIAFLWLSHRLHDAYVHAVGREERRQRPKWFERLRRGNYDHRPAPHLGHKLFLVVDFAALAALMVTLRAWCPPFRQAALDDPRGLAHFSIATALLLAIWLMVEGRHLQRFYQHLVRSARPLRGEVVDLAFEDALMAGAGRYVFPAAIAWTAVPFVAALLGAPLVTASSSMAATLSTVLVFAALPLGLVALRIAICVQRLRATLYR